MPWCRVRCPYCAFEIVPQRGEPPSEAFVTGVLRDLERWRPHFPGRPETAYFGGGTPSRLPPDTLGAIVASLGASEVTAEANPEDLDAHWLEGAILAGITRISLGVQSLQPRLQRVVGRGHHDAATALENLANSALPSWSADLMFGLPGQTLAELDADLDELLAFAPPHVSLYDLSIEPGTGFQRLHERRGLAIPDEADWAALQDHLLQRLQAAGLERYEISNFARPGHRSRHNTLYWSQGRYLGAGPSAHGFAPDGRRWVNQPWVEWARGCEPRIETPSPRQAAIDALISGLRGIDGLDPAQLGSAHLDPATLGRLEERALLEVSPNRIRLTARGFDVSNAVLSALTDTLIC